MSKLKDRRVGAPISFSFAAYLSAPVQRKSAGVLLLLLITLYVFLVWCYPYPIHCLPDASGYIHAANEHWKVNYRPYGYSAFLNFVHGLSPGMAFLTFAQYLLHALSTAIFIYTVGYLFALGRRRLYLLMVLCVVAPLPLYFTNYAISDSLFCSLTVVWITTGLWVLHRRRVWLVAVHLVFMLLALKIKYAGLIYPFISAVVLVVIYAEKGWWPVARALAIGAVPLIVLFFYYTATMRALRRETGIQTFSGFSGWSMANNATMILPYITADLRQTDDQEIRVAHYFAMQYPMSQYHYNATQNSTDFIWNKERAGKALLNYVLQQGQRGYFPAWVHTGYIWGKYGSFLMRHHPLAFARHFVWPNFKETFYPTRIYLAPREMEVSDLIRARYQTSLKTFSHRWDVVRTLESALRAGILVSWVLVAGAMVVFVICRNRLAYSKPQQLMLMMGMMTLLLYSGFVVAGHPFEQRYVINVHVLKMAIPVLIFSKLYMSLPKNNSTAKS